MACSKRPVFYVLIAVFATYVESPRPIHEAKPIPRQWRGDAERQAQLVVALGVTPVETALKG